MQRLVYAMVGNGREAECTTSPDPRQGGYKMIRRAALSLAAMGLTLVATSGMALAQGGGTCAAGSCLSTPGGDLMIGTPYSNGRHGLGSNDLIRGLGGNDFLTGDTHNAAVDGGSGEDRVEGEAGDDLVKGGRGDDRVIGGSGGDVLRGGSGADRIEAQDGFADVISCGASSGDLVVFDPDLDSVAADCEAPRPRCPSPGARGVGGSQLNVPPQYPPAIENPGTQCNGLCQCKNCDELRILKANGSCEKKYRRKCT